MIKNIKILAFATIVLIATIAISSCDENTAEPADEFKPARIDSVSPSTVNIGDTITIWGDNFASFDVDSHFVKIDTIKLAADSSSAPYIISWNDSKIEAIIPDNARFGARQVTVSTRDSSSGAVDIYIVQPEFPGIGTVLIPSGTFIMGDISGAGFDEEKPVRRVTLTRDFYMSKYEITQAQWTSLIPNNPSPSKNESAPVHNISWLEAAQYCNILSERESLEKCYTFAEDGVEWDFDASGYRLPTEAEWEYACRAGTQTDFYSGDDEISFSIVAWYGGNSEGEIRPVGEKAPNAFGLYDMHGNAYEFVWDKWSTSLEGLSETDPTGAETSYGRVLRGGCWVSLARSCRSSSRSLYEPPYWKNEFAGFRIVRTK